MQQAMDRLTAALERHRRLVLVGWLVLLVAALPFAMRQTEHLTAGGFSVPGSGSAAADRALEDFDHASSEPLSVVVADRGGGAAATRREIARVEKAVAGKDHVSLPARSKRAALADAGKSPITVVALRVSGTQDQAADIAVDLRKDLGVKDGERDGVQPYLVGQQALWAGMQDLSKEDLERAEFVGFPIVLLILLAVFGSLAAAALPLALGVMAVMISGAAVFFLSQATDMSVFVTNVASMIGIGVAVDYSLFVLARYREEVREGAEPDDARRIAMRTSGLAVAFSGVTVIISLAGLFLVNSTTIRSMALGAIMVVAVAILAAMTFLPAAIALLGRRAYSRGRIAQSAQLVVRNWRNLRRRPGRSEPGTAAQRPAFWQRWTDHVTRRPVLYATASAAVLLVMAIPALSLEFGDGALRQFPQDNETRVGAELAAKRFGPGAAAPTQIVAELQSGTATAPANEAALAAFTRELRKDPEVAKVAPAVPSTDGRSVLIAATPRHDGESPQARALLDRLRDGGLAAPLERVAVVDVGGATAAVEDFKDLISGSMWKIALFVLLFSYLVLFALLRSVFLPLKAVLMNLLSVGAAYGVLVAVFQYGWFDGFLGFESLGYINTITPPFLLAVVFGLSMDYEVFLLSRIRERYDATGDTRLAVAQGLAKSAATITSAALIMVAVFAVFAGTGVPSVKEIGLGLAVAIALDATIVRLILVPATMEIMGKWNWWLPKPLADRLPEANWEASGTADARA
jgi:RND superfamily putative drug exporter